MNFSIFSVLAMVALVTGFHGLAQKVVGDEPKANLIIYPAAKGSPVSDDYQVTVNGQPVPVYTAGVETRGKANQNHPYYFCYFDLSGQASVHVRSTVYPLDKAILHPNGNALSPVVESDGSLRFTVTRPVKVTVMPKGFDELLRVLHIFVNPIEPVPEGPNVSVLDGCPPVEDRIHVKPGETLYIAGGAFIRANVTVTGPGARIIGRGIIDFSTWPHFEGPPGGPFRVIGTDPENPVVIDGVILRQGWRATMSTGGRGIRLRNVKIVSSSVVNDDPIWNSASDVVMEDLFIRGDDDCIGIKGNQGDVRNVSVRDSQLWSDRARNIIFGPESRGDVIENIQFRNLDLYRHMIANDESNSKCLGCYAICIHAGGRSFGSPQRVQNVVFEDLRIHGENYKGSLNLLEIRAVVQKQWGVYAPGTVDGPIVFRNIQYTGDPKAKITIAGYDDSHLVQNVLIQGLFRNGVPVDEHSENVVIGPHTRNIEFRSH
jgi:hypothetical protein